MELKIKDLCLKNRIFLAPMEKINDIAFRILCKNAGCGLTYTGMINPKTKQKIYLNDKPALQLFCTNNKGIKEFMKKYDNQVSLWDFNLGCPAKTAKKHGFGSFLKDLEIIEDILRIMRKNTKKPITIKIRKSPLALNLLEIAEKYCDAICIHPRTYNQGYSGKPDIDFAREIKSKTRLPVIYSGNVNEKNCKELLNKFDYVMIGREAIGRPEIFSKLTKTKFEKSFKDYLKLAKKYNLPFRQIKLQLSNFTKGTQNSAKLRDKISKIKNMKELENGFFF
jgi:tRNA-dihydrouridine synthase B